MAEFFTLHETESRVRFLGPQDSFEITFTPIAGTITASAIAFLEGAGPVGRPRPDTSGRMAVRPTDGPTGSGAVAMAPDVSDGGPDITIPTVGVRIELFAPGGGEPVDALETDSSNVGESVEQLTYDVPSTQANREWRCRVTNTQDGNVRCGGTVGFPSSAHELFETPIPMRLLNHAAVQLVNALGLEIRLDGDTIEVDAPEIRGLVAEKTDRELEPVEKELSGKLDVLFDFDDVELSELTVKVRRDDATPVVHVAAQFDGTIDLVEFVGSFEDPGLTVDFELQTFGNQQARQVGYVADVDFSIENVDVNTAALIALLGPGAALEGAIEDEIEDFLVGKVEGAVTSFLTDPDFRRSVQEYLTEGFTQLAQRGHAFHSITAEGRDFMITHYDPSEGPDFPVPGTMVGDRIAQPPGRTPTATTGPGTADGGEFVEREPSSTEATRGSGQPNSMLFTPPVVVGADGTNLEKIEHLVVLMMENRSFDHMVGYLGLPAETGFGIEGGGRDDVDGLAETMSNAAPGVGEKTVHPLDTTVFPEDPHHGTDQVAIQIADGEMSGFVESFIDLAPLSDPALVMGFHHGEQVSTYDYLAEHFLLCNRWFSSHPGPTQPNRFCTLGGLTPTLSNIGPDDPRLGFLDQPTVFDWMTLNGVSWTYYDGDVAFLRMFDRFRLDDSNVVPFEVRPDCPEDDRGDDFFTRAERGELPDVTFIDPDFVTIPPQRTANDDHPVIDISKGQALVAQIHDALVSGPEEQWEKTLFVVTYDEHGGFFDHVAPPGTPASDEGANSVPPVHPDGPSHYGPRVPTFVVSPWVPDGETSDVVFDHTSIIKTILVKWGPSDQVVLDDVPTFPSMGPRVQQAAHLGTLLTNDTPRLDVPRLTPELPDWFWTAAESPVEEADLEEEPALDDFHEAMRRFGRPQLSREPGTMGEIQPGRRASTASFIDD